MSRAMEDPTDTALEILTTVVVAEILSAVRSLADREGRDMDDPFHRA